MPSPFPGLDPFMEYTWRDVHTSLITYARNQLKKQMPGDLRARAEEEILVEDDGDSINRAVACRTCKFMNWSLLRLARPRPFKV